MQDGQEVVCGAVQLKLPVFWPNQAKTWFTQAEVQFQLRNITADETKYFHVVASFDQGTATRLTDIIENPPVTDKYNSLKKKVLEIFCLSECERATRMLQLSGLGDRRPSELMEEMLQLHGNNPYCYLFKAIFLHQLPATLRIHLADMDFSEPRKLSKYADTLWQANNYVSHDHGTHAAAVIRGSTRNDKPSKLCYYHQRFGNSSTRCRPPCSFQGNEKTGHQ